MENDFRNWLETQNLGEGTINSYAGSYLPSLFSHFCPLGHTNAYAIQDHQVIQDCINLIENLPSVQFNLSIHTKDNYLTALRQYRNFLSSHQ